MSGTEGGLLKILGQVFLLITFFATVVVAIKVLMGGRSGSGNTRHKQTEDTPTDIYKRGTPHQKSTQPPGDEQK